MIFGRGPQTVLILAGFAGQQGSHSAGHGSQAVAPGAAFIGSGLATSAFCELLEGIVTSPSSAAPAIPATKENTPTESHPAVFIMVNPESSRTELIKPN